MRLIKMLLLIVLILTFTMLMVYVVVGNNLDIQIYDTYYVISIWHVMILLGILIASMILVANGIRKKST